MIFTLAAPPHRVVALVLIKCVTASARVCVDAPNCRHSRMRERPRCSCDHQGMLGRPLDHCQATGTLHQSFHRFFIGPPQVLNVLAEARDNRRCTATPEVSCWRARMGLIGFVARPELLILLLGWPMSFIMTLISACIEHGFDTCSSSPARTVHGTLHKADWASDASVFRAQRGVYGGRDRHVNAALSAGRLVCRFQCLVVHDMNVHQPT